MGLSDIIKALLSGDIKLENWTVSRNGHPLGVPTLAEPKVVGNTFEPHFQFKELTASDDVKGKRPLIGGGGPEGTFKGTAVTGGHIALRHSIHGAPPRLEVLFVLSASPDDHIRFDADVAL